VEEAQATTGGVGEEAQTTRFYCGRGGVDSSRRPRRDRHQADVEEGGASHPSSVGNRFEADSLDASMGNRADTGDARIQADGEEQPWASGC
jgi:hypothetical protein